MARTTTTYRCNNCGWNTVKWVGRCADCKEWGTVVEVTSSASSAVVSLAPTQSAMPIVNIAAQAAAHRRTGVSEFDRVLGGGVVAGAAILISGEPGVGKSTLLLEVAARVAASGRRVLYISAEESAVQVRLRAERMGALHEELFLASESDLATVLGQIDATGPNLLIVDSVQTVSNSLVDGLPGQPSQVREVAATLIRVAKERDLPLILVGHVTKDGAIAGPRMLEHLVDVVCQFEGDRQTSLRFVRALKNRFGPTDEIGCFEMTSDGMAEVPDPSTLFLSRSQSPVSGTCVTVTLEGRRALPVEVQALVVATKAPQPRRVVNGVDPARVAMIIAVLERRVRMSALGEHDIYVSTVGGVRLTEPAADLAIAVAIASAMRDRAMPHNLVAFGEISLAGELRPVTAAERRTAEAQRLGYTTIIDSAEGSVHAGVERAMLLAPKPG